MFEQREWFRKKRDEAAFTRCSTHFSSFSSRFSKMSYQSVSDFIFRFTLAIRRCTTIRSFSCFCQSVLAQYRSLRFHPRESHSMRMSIASHCSFFLSFSFFLLHSNLLFFHNGCDVETDYACVGKYKILFYFIQFFKSNKNCEAFISCLYVYCIDRYGRKN